MDGLKDKSVIEIIENDVNELLSLYDQLIPPLVNGGSPLTAIETLNFLDYSIFECYKKLTFIYSLFLEGQGLLNALNSDIINVLKAKKLTKVFGRPGLHKTYGVYLENDEKVDGLVMNKLLSTCKDNLRRDLENDEFVTYSRLKEIIFYEIQYMILVLKDVVELGWHLDRDENDNKDSTPYRYISKEVKMSVWRRDFGRCCECGSRERLEYDHIIPVSKGGSGTERNIQLLCELCNRRKAANIS